MSKALYLYSPLSLSQLELIVEAHKTDFDDFLNEIFSEEELALAERSLDELAAICVQPIFDELTFQDFSPKPGEVEEQRLYFEDCKSSICIENLPMLETNVFQVTYLRMLISKFENILIDLEDILLFKNDYLQRLDEFKSLDSFTPKPVQKPSLKNIQAPVDPIDFLLRDIYLELERLKKLGKLSQISHALESESKEVRILFRVMIDEQLNADTGLKKSGLSPKAFDDYLEKLKFFLKSY